MGGHHMPQQILAVFFAIAALVFGSGTAVAAGGTSNFRSSDDWRNYYQNQGAGVADLQSVTQNTGLGIQARVGACRAGNGVWNGTGCDFPQQQPQAGNPMDLPDPRVDENGVGGPVPGAGGGQPAAGGAQGPVVAQAGAAQDRGAQRAAMCSMPGNSCDDDGNLTQEFEDGSRMVTDANGNVVPEGGGRAAAGAGAGAAAGGAVSAAPDSLEAMCPYTNTGSPSPPQGPEDAEAANCSATKSTTSTACLTPGTGGMNAGEAAMFTMMMNQMVGLAGQIASAGKNMAQQCRLQADISTAMTAINGIKGTACGVMISQCNKRCGTSAAQFSQAAAGLTAKANAARSTVGGAAAAAQFDAASEKCQMAARKAKSAATQCSSYSGQVMAMMMGAMQHGAGIAQNKQCAAEASAFANQPVPTFSPIALPNPTDCSDPNNQSLACFCSRESNAKSPMCAGFNPGAVAGGGATTNGPGNGIGSSTATPFLGTGDDGAGTDGNTVDPFASKQNASNGGDGFSPGGGSPPGGGGLGSLGGDDGGSGGFGDPRSAITGTSGGQGGSLGGSGGGGGGGGLARNNGTAGAFGNFMDKFNLKKFLPGSKYKTRGIAGMSVKSVDGITGPMGPSLFEKATRQYQEQIQKQNVILDK